MSQQYARELDIAVEAVRTAARVCRGVQEKITDDVLEKQDRSPVTVADFASQALICRALADAFPETPIVAEEDAAELRAGEQPDFVERVRTELEAVGGKCDPQQLFDWIDLGGGEPGGRFWTLDPIDGTKGFLRKQQYAISLALIEGGRVNLAVLACPNLSRSQDSPAHGSLLTAVRGQGAYQYALDKEDPPAQLCVSPVDSPYQSRFCESVESGHSAHDQSAQVAQMLGISTDPVRLDSQAKYAILARGEAEIYLRLPTRADYREKIWDHAGGTLVVEEAGGKVTDVAGRPLLFNQGRELSHNRGVVVTNGKLHDRVLAALKEVDGEAAG